jgi:hypothetical protein
MTKPSKQLRHSLHVLWTIAALNKTAANNSHIGNRLLYNMAVLDSMFDLDVRNGFGKRTARRV